jgi:hypothetical protein
MLDGDLAALYGVETKVFNQSVRRNIDRFPADFMFKLTTQETLALRSQIVTLERGRGQFTKYAPYAFTEHGVAMLSAILKSKRAVEMSIAIVRAFIRMRELIASNQDITARVERLEQGQARTVSVIESLAEDINMLNSEIQDMKALPPLKKRKIGFRAG